MKTGDLVQFSSRKGLVKGPIIAVKWSKRGQKAARQFNAMLRLRGEKQLLPEGREVYEIADLENETIWIVEDCKAIGKATAKQLHEGRVLKAGIKLHNDEMKIARASRNNRKQDERGISRLNRGDKIQVKYRGGYWKEEIFSHYTSSGKIAFKSSQTKKGVRYCWPDAVRKAE